MLIFVYCRSVCVCACVFAVLLFILVFFLPVCFKLIFGELWEVVTFQHFRTLIYSNEPKRTSKILAWIVYIVFMFFQYFRTFHASIHQNRAHFFDQEKRKLNFRNSHEFVNGKKTCINLTNSILARSPPPWELNEIQIFEILTKLTTFTNSWNDMEPVPWGSFDFNARW